MASPMNGAIVPANVTVRWSWSRYTLAPPITTAQVVSSQNVSVRSSSVTLSLDSDASRNGSSTASTSSRGTAQSAASTASVNLRHLLGSSTRSGLSTIVTIGAPCACVVHASANPAAAARVGSCASIGVAASAAVKMAS